MEPDGPDTQEASASAPLPPEVGAGVQGTLEMGRVRASIWAPGEGGGRLILHLNGQETIAGRPVCGSPGQSLRGTSLETPQGDPSPRDSMVRVIGHSQKALASLQPGSRTADLHRALGLCLAPRNL